MTLIHQQMMPASIPIQMVDEVTDATGVDADPPTGLIIHAHYEVDGQVHIMDIWESQDAYDTFNADRLGPASRTVAEAHGMDTPDGPRPTGTIHQVHRLVRGA